MDERCGVMVYGGYREGRRQCAHKAIMRTPAGPRCKLHSPAAEDQRKAKREATTKEWLRASDENQQVRVATRRLIAAVMKAKVNTMTGAWFGEDEDMIVNAALSLRGLVDKINIARAKRGAELLTP